MSWSQLVDQVTKKHGPALGTCLKAAKPLALAQGVLRIGVPDAFSQETLKKEADGLREVLMNLTRTQLKTLTFQVRHDPGSRDDGTDRPLDLGKRLQERIREDAVVRALHEKFDVTPVW